MDAFSKPHSHFLEKNQSLRILPIKSTVQTPLCSFGITCIQDVKIEENISESCHLPYWKNR
jgi:hypothetical protein